ncbi:hypothetical protein [Gemmatimonas sp.]|uniref:hypothetical protein n=1 Tax=Gemmatimonas sp. TaxID=1962908 RepID=UPI00398361AF
MASFLLLRPYIGIVHDARLYVGYAMASIDPSGIGQDILFLHDGQSVFSIYPRVLKALVLWIGPSRAAMASAFVGLSLWLAAFLVFARQVFGPLSSTKHFLAACALSLAVPSYYGGTTVLRFAEPFATPRAFAEAMSLISLAWMSERRRLPAVFALLVGLLVHPLMTLPAMGVAIWIAVQSRRMRQILIAIGICGSIVLCAIPLLGSPAGILSARFDIEWLRILNEKYSLVFLRHWHSLDFARILLHLATIALAWSTLTLEAKAVVGGVLIMSLGGALLSLIGADLVSSVLITQGQAWRGLWLLAIVASMLLAKLTYDTFSARQKSDLDLRDARRIAAVSLLLAAWFAVRVGSAAWVLAGLAVFLGQAHRFAPSLTLPKRGELVIVAISIAVAVSVTAIECGVVGSLVLSSPEPNTMLVWQTAVLSGVPALAVIVWAIGAMRTTADRWSLSAVTVVSAASLAAAVLLFDSRQPYQRFVEHSLDQALLEHHPNGRQPIAWSGGDLEPWAIESAPAWGSVPQGISVVFSRDLAFLWRARWDLLDSAQMRAPTGADSAADAWIPHVDITTLRTLCFAIDRPGSIVVPSQSFQGFPAEVRRLSVPHFIAPRKFGGRWARVDSVSRVDCARITKQQIGAQNGGAETLIRKSAR